MKGYFQNLNAIRFIVAFLVIIHYVEQLKFNLHAPNHWDNAVVQIIGKLGVVLFFEVVQLSRRYCDKKQGIEQVFLLLGTLKEGLWVHPA